MHLRNRKVVRPLLQPGAGIPEIVSPNRDTARHLPESKQTERSRATSLPAAGVGRAAPKNRDHDAGGRKDLEMNYARMEHEIAELCRQMDSQMTMGQRPAPQRLIAYEDEKNMRNFLDLLELEFIDLGIRAQQWGEELRRYLKDDALGYWLYLHRTGTPLTHWDLGVTLTPDQLVRFYLANLPEEQCRVITQGGMRKFTEWQEAAAALAASEAPWKATYEERLRYQEPLADAWHRAENGGQKRSPRRELARGGYLRDDNTEARCYECRGKGYLGRDFPLRNGATRHSWETRSRCGGRDHYARECATMRMTHRLTEGRTSTRTATRGTEGTTRSNERALREMNVLGDRYLQETTRAWWLPGLMPFQSPPTGGSDSFQRGRAIRQARTRNEDEGAADIYWLREGTPLDHAHEGNGSLCGTSKTAVLTLEIARYECEELLDTGASRSFISPAAAKLLGLRRKSGGLAVDTPATGGRAKTPADRAYDVLAQQVSRMTAEEAATLSRQPPKLYKPRHRAGERLKIKDLLREARNDTEKLKQALDGLHVIEALPEAEAKGVVYLPTERQGPLMCAIVEYHRTKTWSQDVQSAVVAAPADADTEASPWPAAELEYTELDAWP
ncbi:hypothetical protein, conserved [Eimeria praecox]|uniref:Uncharacterized protein n=1 Tax=Eimeria praecox TaxID=51316 RepID=U6GZ20_9EIME|nr:hypothetical protein, conserved [Eimeria praecox]